MMQNFWGFVANIPGFDGENATFFEKMHKFLSKVLVIKKLFLSLHWNQ